MALDRDLNVAILTAALPTDRSGRGVDLLAATGVRGLRLLCETGCFGQFVLAERQPRALATLAVNASRFEAEGARVVRTNSARPGLRGPFEYVDVDPFGTPIPFLEAALSILAPDGVLAVTATDMPVLAGVARGVAARRYGGSPVRGRLGPEAGLRLLVGELARRARSAGRSVRPLACYIHDHHVRAIVRLGSASSSPDPLRVLDPATFEGPRLPPGGPYGPLWAGPLFDPELASRLRPPADAARPKEAARWIERFREEAQAPGLFYYESNELARDLHLGEPPAPDRLVEALRSRGFPSARTHAREGAVRSTADRVTVGAVVRELVGPSP